MGRNLGSWRPPGATQGLAQDELYLRVQAAQIVVRPALHALEHRRVDPKKKGPAIRHTALRARTYW